MILGKFRDILYNVFYKDARQDMILPFSRKKMHPYLQANENIHYSHTNAY